MSIKTDRKKVLRMETINPHVVQAEYAVRGELAIKAEELRTDLQENSDAASRLGFSQVISANIGNPQQLGQKGLTFLRQVCALSDYPDIMDNPHADKLFPRDAMQRARSLLKEIHSTGAYTHSKGIPMIRKHVAQFIQERDGFPADPEMIYLTGGASSGVANVMSLLLSDPSSGVLVPIPQYPLYTASLTLHNAHACPYYLKEKDDWSTSIQDIKQSLKSARAEGIDVRAIVVINPGNPTGSCLQAEQIADVLKLAYSESLVVLADEVYQTNVFHPDTRPFASFKKVLRSLGKPYADAVELISFHSTSKGQIGECGRRGGYLELVNIDPEVEKQMYKLFSISLCAPVSGQIAVDVMIHPPQPGDESYDLYSKEVAHIQNSLKSRSSALLESFRGLEGVECQDAQGAMYLFPKIKLTPRAIQAAREQKKEPDAFYCMELLKKTGICLVPGSGFGQEPNTLHFRTTFLAPEVEDYCKRITNFHKSFMEQYR